MCNKLKKTLLYISVFQTRKKFLTDPYLRIRKFPQIRSRIREANKYRSGSYFVAI